MTERRVYSESFKREAVRLSQERGEHSVAWELGISEVLLSQWKTAFSAAPEKPFLGCSNSHSAEIALLERENALLREEIAILRKAVGIFNNESSDANENISC